MKIFLSLVCIGFFYFLLIRLILKFQKSRLEKRHKKTYINSKSVSLLTTWWLAAIFIILFIIFKITHYKYYLIEISIAILISLAGLFFTNRYFLKKAIKRHLFNFDTTTKLFMYLAVSVSVGITIITFLTLCIESIKFFKYVNVIDFIFGKKWYPDDYEFDGSKAFGILPLMAGTFVISTFSIIIAFPIGIMSAIYITEYASQRNANIFKSILEVLSGIPTIVYGYFAAFVFSPFFVALWDFFNFNVSFESGFNAAIVIGIMIIPYITSLCFDIFVSMPSYLRHASFAVGSTKYEMVKYVLLPYARPKLYSVITLALSRAIGETMIVVMCAGLVGNLSINPFESLTTFTVQIVELLVGDNDLSAVKSKSAFALALSLFIITLLINSASMFFAKRSERKK